MRMVRFAFALFTLSAAGCAVDAADPDLAVDAPNLSENWTVSSFTTPRSWSSGLVGTASGYIHCNTDYGEGYMLTDLSVNEEPLANPAEFIASMNGVCREFDLPDIALPRTGTYASAAISAAPSRPGLHWTHVPANDSYPIGLQLRVDPIPSPYVKDVRIMYAHKDATGMALDVAAPSFTPWAIGYAGNVVSLNCPAKQVMTGLDLDYDPGSGQIRFLEIHCRELSWP